MKRIFSLLACLTVLLSLVVPAFAVEETEPESPVAVEPETVPHEVSYMDYSVISLDETSSEPVPDSIPAVITALFGEYSPRTQTVTEFLSDGSEITYQQYVPGLAGLDWLWLSSVGLFGMTLYCIFRAIGGCLKWI